MEDEEYYQWKKENLEELREDYTEDNDEFEKFCEEEFKDYKDVAETDLDYRNSLRRI